jgi:hypothetical protein
MADQEKIITQHPLLYHMAEGGAWANIRQHGLLSTTALLRLFEVNEPQRSAIGSWYRRSREVVRHSDYGCAAIRDQTPMPPGKLRLALTDMDPSEWYKLLNGKVFFWSTKDRLISFLKARSHRNRPHDVLTICTRSLVEQYANEITLSPINSGTVRMPTHRRGSDTFQPITAYPCRTRRECFAELAVEGCVPDMERHTLSVDRWMGEARQQNIWRR